MSIQKVDNAKPYRNGGGVILVASVGEVYKAIDAPIMPEPKLTNVNEDIDYPTPNP